MEEEGIEEIDQEKQEQNTERSNARLEAVDWSSLLKLAFQSIGVVYGDLGTSILCTLLGIFPHGVEHNDDILGVLSLILWAITLITLTKYVFIVLAANDNGDVLSSVSGIREATSSLIDNTVMWISVAILFLLFQVQRFGTDKVGYSFAPILTIWFVFIGIIGFYDFLKYDPGVIKAINPMYIVRYFIRRKKDAWISLGGVVMCLRVHV
ncbi:hypothetical protein IFM89_020559 [Coptis chinensis]|uniref:K+ potassium transporter integral membrane domain-containing protein n=1 Tax=Coptis chinensis TaxID=261450 RepID=A0A835M8M7_9MAGN|nr:hypothetical protein IFM89_020559 [Coptis chinensis]